MNDVTPLLRKPISHSIAVEHAKQNKNLTQDGNFFSLTSGAEELGDISIGVALYFHYLFWSALFFFALFFASVLSLVFYVKGNQYSQSAFILRTWQGNVGFEVEPYYLGVNISVLFLWILFTLFLRHFQNKMEYRIRQKESSIDKYSVEITTLKKGTNLDSLRRQLEEFGDIYKMVAIPDNIHLIAKCSLEISSLQQQMERAQDLANPKDLEKLHQKHQEAQKRLGKFTSEAQEIFMAIVTFTTEEAANLSGFLCCESNCTTPKNQFVSFTPNRASLPSDIVYQNLKSTTYESVLRISSIMTLITAPLTGFLQIVPYLFNSIHVHEGVRLVIPFIPIAISFCIVVTKQIFIFSTTRLIQRFSIAKTLSRRQEELINSLWTLSFLFVGISCAITFLEKGTIEEIINSLFLTSLQLAFLEPILALIRPFQRVRKFIQRKRAKTQRELNEAYDGPDFNLAENYANTYIPQIIAAAMGAQLPFLYLFTGIYFLFRLIVDKYTCLRIACKSPKYNGIASHGTTGAQLTFLVVFSGMMLITANSLILLIVFLTIGSFLLLSAFGHIVWLNGICSISYFHKHDSEASKIPVSSASRFWEEKDKDYEKHHIPKSFVIVPNPLDKPPVVIMQ